jgi:hypothetical protein
MRDLMWKVRHFHFGQSTFATGRGNLSYCTRCGNSRTLNKERK